ncbi:MAG: peroxiredoxin [Methanomicrobiales archaeon]|nr:peroxiredoxin [Methanomicrobiales archaeon]
MGTPPQSPASGEPAPDFCLPDQNGKEICLKDLRGRWVILYFYPRDNTPGCTIEGMEFTAALKEFEALGATVLGMSPDTPESHKKFMADHDLRHTLLSDRGHGVLAAYGVWSEKSLLAGTFLGVERATYLIRPDRTIGAVWRKVKPRGHAAEVKAELERLR